MMEMEEEGGYPLPMSAIRPRHVLISKEPNTRPVDERIIGTARSDEDLPAEMVKVFKQGHVPGSYDVYSRNDTLSVETRVAIAVSIPGCEGEPKTCSSGDWGPSV